MAQLDSDRQDYLEQLTITNGKNINKIHTANQATVTLNETLLHTITAENNKIKKLFQMVADQANAPPTTNNQIIVPPPFQH